MRISVLLAGVLVAAQGHPEPKPRTMAVRMLNCLYDGTDWQLKYPLLTAMSEIGEPLVVDVYTVLADDDKASDVRVLVSAPSYDTQVGISGSGAITTMHTPIVSEEDIWLEYEPMRTDVVTPGAVASPLPNAPSSFCKVNAARIRLQLNSFTRCGTLKHCDAMFFFPSSRSAEPSSARRV
jgi:hypothetical protein